MANRVEIKGVTEPAQGGKQACCAFVLFDADGNEITHSSGWIGQGDGWIAEYGALIRALRFLRDSGIKGAIIITGMNAIVGQLESQPRDNGARLYTRILEAYELLQETQSEIRWERDTRTNRASYYARKIYERVVRKELTQPSEFRLKYSSEGILQNIGFQQALHL